MQAARFWRSLLPRVSVFSAFVANRMSGDDVNSAAANSQGLGPSALLRKHPRFWLDDGSLILKTKTDAFKVHRTLLTRHSPVLLSLSGGGGAEEHSVVDSDGCRVVEIPDALGVDATDLEVLLEHLYHDVPLDNSASFDRIASVFRVTSRRQLDIFAIHRRAQRQFEELVPSNAYSLAQSTVSEPDKALTLAVDYELHSIQKPLFYVVATHALLEHEEPEGDVPERPLAPLNAEVPASLQLSPEVTTRCQTLLNDLIAHFTPILFTVATAGHMACTDVFAEKWMPLVIQPALENSGLCRPLETLQTIIDLDWQAEGLCEECVKEKTEEWRGEQVIVWERLDGWLGLEAGS